MLNIPHTYTPTSPSVTWHCAALWLPCRTTTSLSRWPTNGDTTESSHWGRSLEEHSRSEYGNGLRWRTWTCLHSQLRPRNVSSTACVVREHPKWCLKMVSLAAIFSWRRHYKDILWNICSGLCSFSEADNIFWLTWRFGLCEYSHPECTVYMSGKLLGYHYWLTTPSFISIYQIMLHSKQGL